MIGQAVGTDCDVPVLYDVTDIADMVVETRCVVIINATAESDVGVVA